MQNKDAFLALVRAGLWEREARLLPYSDIDYAEMLRMAEAQSVVGLVTAGLDHVEGVKVPYEMRLVFVGSVAGVEQRNKAMNGFIAVSVEKMREFGITPLLVKGQGLAQCYERPQWRTSGDVDFFFSKDEYNEAVGFFTGLKNAKVVQNARYTKSFGVNLEPWFIELHGTLRNSLSTRMDKEIDAVQDDTFKNKRYRVWQNGVTEVLLPNVDNDVFLVFVHFVRHFYKEGICLRQICDWCRLLWTYRGQVDVSLLEKRLQRAGAMAEWKAFAALAVEYLEMPIDDIPLYGANKKWQQKGEKIMRLILDGNTHNKMRDTIAVAKIFPWNTLLFTPALFFNVNGLKIKERIFSNDNHT